MKNICTHCILPDTFPKIVFNEKGICNFCQNNICASKKQNYEEKTKNYRNQLDSLIESHKGKAPVYDLIMAYSGGKDSSFTLKLLRERYDLRIAALTFDNHFISSTAIKNIKIITDRLNIDSLTFKPPWSIIKEMFLLTAKEDIFSKPTLMRASSICTACIGLVKSIVLKTALEMSIPFVGFGWSPGQAPLQSAIMKTNPSFIRSSQTVYKNSFPYPLGNLLSPYLLPDTYFDSYINSFPHNIHPLAFFDYNEDDIKKELTDIGWQPPEVTDSNSSNCLINAFANQCHINRNEFHPYVWEIANMVRQGILTREQGIEKIYAPQNKKMIEYAEIKLFSNI